MIRSMKFKKDHRCFKKGDFIEFHLGVNLLVGLNGCGKSTLIQLITDYKTPLLRDRTTVVVDLNIDENTEISTFDFEKDNKRTLSYFGDDIEFQVASHFSSHGETLVATLNQLMYKAQKDSVLVLDEPDMAASVRVAMAIRDGFGKVSVEKKVQIIAAIHHPFIMREQEVFDVAALCWKSGDDVIKEMCKPGPLFIEHKEQVEPRKRYGKLK